MSGGGPSAKGLPSIEPYPLPVRSELPAVRVPWSLDAGRAALLVHDVQGYFMGAFPEQGPPADDMLRNTRRILDRCDALGIPVFYTAQPPSQDPLERGLQADFWGPGIGDTPEEVDIVESVAPGPSHEVLTKWRYSAFQRSPLAGMMVDRERDQLLVTGVYAHIGCMLSAAEAFMLDIQPFFVGDAVADFSRAYHDTALEQVASSFGRVLLTEDVLEAM